MAGRGAHGGEQRPERDRDEGHAGSPAAFVRHERPRDEPSGRAQQIPHAGDGDQGGDQAADRGAGHPSRCVEGEQYPSYAGDSRTSHVRRRSFASQRHERTAYRERRAQGQERRFDGDEPRRQRFGGTPDRPEVPPARGRMQPLRAPPATGRVRPKAERRRGERAEIRDGSYFALPHMPNGVPSGPFSAVPSENRR